MDLSETVRVGRIEMSAERAIELVQQYTSVGADPKARNPRSYPAYDLLATGTSADELNDGDLLAPVLLNVQVSIRAMYGLQAVRERLETALANPALAKSLQSASVDEIRSAVRPIYSIIDGQEKPLDVGVTKLSKLVHRKRPRFLALHDAKVRSCYFGKGARIPFDNDRSWADYMVALHVEVAKDIREQPELFAEIRGSLPQVRSLTDVRLLDIIAWSVGSGRR